MIPVMDRVGKAIRKAYHWVPMDQKCYLVMDNADGHRIDNVITKYTRLLKDTYNVVIIH